MLRLRDIVATCSHLPTLRRVEALCQAIQDNHYHGGYDCDACGCDACGCDVDALTRGYYAACSDGYKHGNACGLSTYYSYVRCSDGIFQSCVVSGEFFFYVGVALTGSHVWPDHAFDSGGR
jgi:hypothetical protein